MTDPKLPPETLRQIPILRSLNDEEQAQLLQAARLEQYADGAEILQQGGMCQNLWIVLEGECDVVKQLDVKQLDGRPDKREVVLATLRPLENFGEMSFFQAAPHAAAVRARGPVKLIRIPWNDYSALIDGGVGAAYKLAYNTVQSLAERLRRMDDWVAALLSESPQKKPPGEWLHFRDQLLKEWNL
jgi:CRP-like cAMP-binding protein